MADTRDFKDYFALRPLSANTYLELGDELLILRAGAVERVLAVPEKAEASFDGNLAPTVIAGAGIFEPIEGALTLNFSTPQFNLVGEELVYIGVNQITSSLIRASVSMVADNIVDRALSMALFINAVQVGPEIAVGSVDGFTGFGSVAWFHAFQNGDAVHLEVKNLLFADDIFVRNHQLIVEA